MILGIIALVTIPLVPFKWIPALVGVGAIVWGILGIRHARMWETGKGKDVWGLVLGAVALPIALIALIATSPSFQQGLQDGENAARFNKVQVEKDIKAGVEEQTGTALDSVQCPETPTVKEGASFECVARTTDGTNVLVNVRIQDNKGNYIWEITN